MKLTRRQIALAAMAQEPAATTYTGALDNHPVDAARFDPVVWARQRWNEAPRQLRFEAANRKQALAWQKKLRAKLTTLLGGFPDRPSALAPRILEQRDFPGYTREKFIFESRPGLGVLAYLLKPAKASGPLPVAICVPGHGRGVDDIVGIDEKGRPRTDKAGYQHDFALQMVEQGVAALAIEPLAFGCRRDPANKKRGLTANACQPAAGAALLFGETMIAWRAWDVMRAIDWIETRKDLDADRVGCLGISGGGTCTLFTTALEPRIKAALVSGYLNTFRDSILSIGHCMDNYVPGILNWCEMSDVAGLVAPRPLYFESGERDRIFPVEAAREAFGEVKKIYEVFGAADQTGHETFPDEHVFFGRQGVPFLARALAKV